MILVMAQPLPFDAIAEARRQWHERWPQASTSMATATAAMRAQQIVLSAVDGVLRPLGLTFARYEALVLLSFTRSGTLPMGKMGSRLMIHPTSVTNIVNRLSNDALVTRSEHPDDGRSTLVRLTPKGRRLGERATRAVNEIHFGIEGLSDAEQNTFIKLVRTMRLAVGDFSES